MQWWEKKAIFFKFMFYLFFDSILPKPKKQCCVKSLVLNANISEPLNPDQPELREVGDVIFKSADVD